LRRLFCRLAAHKKIVLAEKLAWIRFECEDSYILKKIRIKLMKNLDPRYATTGCLED
jgi:hypothetical protein